MLADVDGARKRRHRKAPATLRGEIESPSEAGILEKKKQKVKGGQDKKALRGLNAPRAAQSAFMYFSKQEREEHCSIGHIPILRESVTRTCTLDAQARLEVLQEVCGTLSFTEIGRMVANKWKIVSDQQRSECEAMANADRER